MARQEEKCSGNPNTRRLNLIKFRGDRNWTRNQLSKETKRYDTHGKGISETTIYRLEKEKYKRRIYDTLRDLLSKAFEIDPSLFDEHQSNEDSNTITNTQNSLEKNEKPSTLRPKFLPFSGREDSKEKNSISKHARDFHYLANLEQYNYEELRDRTKEYINQIVPVTRGFSEKNRTLVYSLADKKAIQKYFEPLISFKKKTPDPPPAILLNMLGNYHREPHDIYWPNEFQHLNDQLDECIDDLTKSDKTSALNVFALAPQPLVVELGRRCIFQTIPAMDSVPFRPPIPFDPGH